MEPSLFSPLPAPPSRSRLFLAGWGLQALMLATFLVMNALFPAALTHSSRYVVTTLLPYQPLVTRESQSLKPRLHPKAVNLPKVAPVAVGKLMLPAPQNNRVPSEIKAPALRIESTLPQFPARTIPQVVATNTFSSESSTPPTATTHPAAAVQTGGFGDPHGAAPRPSHAANLASLGAFDLPSGVGRGDGTGVMKTGTVTSAGFDSGTAVSSRGGKGVVQQTAFDDRYAAQDPHKTTGSGTPSTTPVEIVFKPKPEYTAEGRKQGIDGEVRLEVLFGANGQVRVLRVLEGLGYGLDEQAVKTAQQIKFKPALHEGQPVDSTAVVHIIFQLAS